MVTLATESICEHLCAHAPVKPDNWYLEANMSGDKKNTMYTYSCGRGKEVIAEAVIPSHLTKKVMHTTPERMFEYWQVSVGGALQSGSYGHHVHVANGLTALFMACGQDTACVAEAAVGVSRLDLTDERDLYVSLKLPNLIVGTIGGATHLPTARECLEMMDCYGHGKAAKFAEICAATALAGELSIMGAFCAGEFGRAMMNLGRNKGTSKNRSQTPYL
jgi:hydroxymethylglutaryl-CoA reductase (NADPH)